MEAPSPEPVQVAGYGGMLRRRWWVLALAALVGLLLAALVPLRGAKTYVATAGVLVLPTGVDSAGVAGGRTGGGIDLDAEARLLTSANVATRAKALLNVPDEPRELAANVSVAVAPESSVLNISYRGRAPEEAQRSVQAFARAYLDNRKAVATARLRTGATVLQSQIGVIRKSLQAVTGKKAALSPASPERAYVEAQENVLIKQVTQLSRDLGQVEEALAARIEPGRVINGP